MPIEINSSTAKAGSYVMAQNLEYSAGCSMEQIFTPINIIKGSSAPGPGFAQPLTPSFEKGMFNNESVGPTILELNPYFPVIFGDNGSNFIANCDYNLVVHAPSVDFNIKKNSNRSSISQIKTQGLRSPLILSGWGYDIAGMPVPTTNGTDFNPSLVNQRSSWKTGPLHVMWDDERQIWTGGYQLVYGVLQQRIRPPNGVLAGTTFKVKVLRRINGQLTSDLGEEIQCINRDKNFELTISDKEIEEEKIFVICARINYEWVLLWATSKFVVYFGYFDDDWKKLDLKTVRQTIPEPEQGKEEVQVYNNLFESVGVKEERTTCSFIYVPEQERYYLISVEQKASEVLYGYFSGKWELNDTKTVRQTKPEPEPGKEEVEVKNILFEKDIHKPENEQTTCSFTKIEDEYYLVSVEQQPEMYIGYFTNDAKRGVPLEVFQLYPEPDPEDGSVTVENNLFDRAGEVDGIKNYCSYTKIGDKYELISIQQRNQHYFGTFTGEWKKTEKKSVKVVVPRPDAANDTYEVENLIYTTIGSSQDDKPRYCYFIKLAPAYGSNLGLTEPDRYLLVAAEEESSPLFFGYFSGKWKLNEDKTVRQTKPDPEEGKEEVTVRNLLYESDIHKPNNQQTTCSFTKIEDTYYLVSVEQQTNQIFFGYFTGEAKRGQTLAVFQLYPQPDPQDQQPVEVRNGVFDRAGEFGGVRNYCCFTKIDDRYDLISIQPRNENYFGTFTGEWKKNEFKTVTVTTPRQIGGNTEFNVENLIYEKLGSSGNNTPNYCHFVRLAPAHGDDLGQGESDKYLLVAAEETGSELRIGYFGDKWRINEEKEVTQVYPEPDDDGPDYTVLNKIFNEVGIDGTKQHWCSFTKIDDEYYLISADNEPSTRFGTFNSSWKKGNSVTVTQTHPQPNPEDSEVQAINLIYDEIGEPGASNQVCAFTKIGNQYYIISVQQYDSIYIGNFSGKWAKGQNKSVTRVGGGPPSSKGTIDIVLNPWTNVSQGSAIYVKIGNTYYLIAAIPDCDDSNTSNTPY
jgi:hypothetical protein